MHAGVVWFCLIPNQVLYKNLLQKRSVCAVCRCFETHLSLCEPCRPAAIILPPLILYFPNSMFKKWLFLHGSYYCQSPFMVWGNLKLCYKVSPRLWGLSIPFSHANVPYSCNYLLLIISANIMAQAWASPLLSEALSAVRLPAASCQWPKQLSAAL